MDSEKNKMTHKKVLIFLSLFITGVFGIPFITSCGSGAAASAVGYNTQLEILNLSPDLQPVNLYLDFIQQGTNAYSYPFGSGYFFLNTITPPLQIRSSVKTTVNLISLTPTFKANHKYTLFITGYFADTSYTSIFTIDDSIPTPKVGFGAIRFVNASLPATSLDVLANGTIAFKNIAYKKVSDYVQVPVGNYNFQISPASAPTTILTTPTLSGGTTTIQDGRLYTLYSYGVIAHTDTSAFDAAILTNR